MPIPAQISLSLELTRLVPAVLPILSYTAATVIKLARELKQHGSDLLVEEDLAVIFSRAKVAPSVENQFKNTVRIGSISPLTPNSEILLDAGPGATLRRALKDDYYLPTVIQLSLLVWMHEPTSLAATLVEAMRQRFELKVEHATPSPDFDGILKTLVAIQSQTSQYPWETLIELVESKFPSSMTGLDGVRTELKRLSPSTLLAAMDYLYLVQSLPEHRVMVIDNQMGAIPIIVWANCILGLGVDVLGCPDGDVHFGGSGEHQVVIKWNQKAASLRLSDLHPPTIYLKDASETVVLATLPEATQVEQLESEERLRLGGYLLKILRRKLNSPTIVPEGHPLHTEAVCFTIALAIVHARKLRRSAYGASKNSQPDILSAVETWKIQEASEVAFDGLEIPWDTVNSYTEAIFNSDGSLRLPPTLQKHSKKYNILHGMSYLNVVDVIEALSRLLLAFAHIVDIRACSQLPLVYSMDILVASSPIKGRDLVSLDCHVWFKMILTMLMGHKYGKELLGGLEGSLCLASARGWSAYIPTFEDNDPGNVDCESVFIKRGVPTNPRTEERRYLIVDGPIIRPLNPPRGPDLTPRIVERADTYTPRCVMPVLRRTEMWTTRSKAFCMSIRYHLEELVAGETRAYTLYTSPRYLNNALWGVDKTLLPCPHRDEEPQEKDLALDVATAAGFEWRLDFGPWPDESPRICICLVKGDARARWLVLGGILEDDSPDVPDATGLERRVLLRCDGCCVSCAVDRASDEAGKWLVVL
ncbi:hypothetical protein NA57DRAFT_79067 [Rhizodiscina lignyota]|uniref:Uncharacterized protein n=1 Tax=Rhizodiscina lignyota TaxID=1504668 RepID=A0A9P4IDM2_9PEZI|nr:hypothetical protein NA57DRAFT_79067 [Rhizodiscina lignyota]